MSRFVTPLRRAIGLRVLADPGATLEELKRLGVDRANVFMHWADVAPTRARTRDRA
jgi:hypothetical protein